MIRRVSQRVVLLCTSATIVLLMSSTSSAGDLNPPGGPIVPTMKDLDTVEPRTPIGPLTTPGDADSLFRITSPGSYYLTGNITGVSGKHGIEIDAIGVTLDLMGFALIGVTGSLDGIHVALDLSLTNQTALRIKDGVVMEWDGNGIDALLAEGCMINNVHALNNAIIGIVVQESAVISDCTVISGLIGIRAGSGSVIERCTADRCTNWGIFALDNCVVSECAANGNSGDGIRVSSGSVQGCSASNNVGSGIVVGSALPDTGAAVAGCHTFGNDGFGIDVVSGGTVIGCSAVLNDTGGIRVGDGSSVIDCVAFDSGGFGSADGITAGQSCQIRGCTVSQSLSGIVTGFDCTISDCKVTTSDLDGIRVSGGCTITNCSTSLNGLDGINTGDGCLILACAARGNGDDGVSVGSRSIVKSNVSESNAFGYFTNVGSDCRIEDNLAAANSGTGFLINGARHLVVRNFARSNGNNYLLDASNQNGPIIIATGTITSTSPWANFADAIPASNSTSIHTKVTK